MIQQNLSPLRFSAFICHDTGRRSPKELGDLRIFRFEATNDTSQYPMGWVVCPESGEEGIRSSVVERFCQNLPQLLTLAKDQCLQAAKKMILEDSKNWKIGENEVLAERKGFCLKHSTADWTKHPDGSLSLSMDYFEDLKPKA